MSSLASPLFRLLATTLGLALVPAPALGQFHDDFTATTLGPAWSWTDPGNDASYKLGVLPGRLRMIVPPGNDHTTGHGPPLYSGPMLTVKATGDFTITTHVAVNYPGVPSAKESGLMIWKDSSNNLQFKRTNAFNSQNVLYYGNIGKVQTTFHGQPVVSANELYLRIVRVGSSFTSYYGTDGKTWTRVGTVTWGVSGTLNVGLATSYWLWWGSGTQPATGDYLFFDLELGRPELSGDRAGLPAVAGGTIGLNLDLGSVRAGQSYLIVGSFSGSSPGIPFPGGRNLPLNWDILSDIMLSLPNLPGFFPGTAGTLSASGTASAKVIIPAAAVTPLVGMAMTFAAVSYTPTTALRPTNAVEIAVSR